jgi:hypothetical protein
MRHDWQTEHDDALRAAVEVVTGQLPLARGVSLWSAVAGRLLPGLVVSADACRARWSRVQEVARQNSSQDATSDAWRVAEERVQAYEREMVETILDGVSEMMGGLDTLVAQSHRVEDTLGLVLARLARLEEVWK